MSEEARPLLAVERRAQIIDLVRRQGVVRIDELSRVFRVSTVTIRSDLDALARQGRLTRERGGAVTDPRNSLSEVFEQRASLDLEEKRRIGRAAAALVSPGDAIIIDAGTTTAEMAKCLYGVTPLTVVTNAINVATEVGAYPGVRVFLVGGALNLDTLSTTGPQTERDLGDLVVQKVFLGADALDADMGVTDISIETAQVKRAMVKAGRHVILLLASSKWGRVALAKVVPLSAVHTLVTDTNLPGSGRSTLESLGAKVILA
jgi:DeoR family transcriptional regulator, aga operon transcriptional repressor